jgi:[ribosomal protein S5]-alanine N-acetyltransferase
MKKRPTLETDRLILRPFTLADAPEVQRLAGEREIAATTLNIPHPYEDGVAERWLGSHQGTFEKGEGVVFAITRQADNALIGSIGLDINPAGDSAELGYWVGKPHWNHGYCTEAAKAVVAYGFDLLKLDLIYAHAMKRNPASERVMQKVGMRLDALLKGHIKKWGVLEDGVRYSLTKPDYESGK